MVPEVVLVNTLVDWNHLAETVVPELVAGDVLALSGPLGAGKTTFTQALAQTLGVKEVPRSPTFSLMSTYQIHNHPSFRRLVHIDAYRLETPGALLALHLEEEPMEPGSLFVIEWPENIQAWFDRQEKYYFMKIIPQTGEQREVRIETKTR